MTPPNLHTDLFFIFREMIARISFPTDADSKFFRIARAKKIAKLGEVSWYSHPCREMPTGMTVWPDWAKFRRLGDIFCVGRIFY
jgi:hypothetical protein